MSERATAAVRPAACIAGVVAVVVAAVVGACASPQAPPGGPPDYAPPRFVGFSPANTSVGAAPDEVVLEFDEVVSEAPRNVRSLDELILVSPRSGDVRVSWKRDRLVVKPRDGFRDSAIYTITVKPGLVDLSNNPIDTATTLVFSTGGPIPNTVITGVFFDWPAGRGASRAIVEAISVVNGTTYLTASDSVGRFRLPYVPPGQYTMRGFIDRNSSDSLERTEVWDTLTVPLRDSTTLELYGFVHDTLAPRIRAVTVEDSGRRLRLDLDRPLAIGEVVSPSQFTLRSVPDSAIAGRVVVVRSLREQRVADSLLRKQRADSVAAARAAADTTPDSIRVARADSLARIARRDSLAKAEREARERRRQIALRGGRPLPEPDTTPPPRLNRPVPDESLVLQLESALRPDTSYYITARGLVALGDVRGDSVSRAFRTPKVDTTKRDSAAADSTRVDSTRRDSTGADSAAVVRPPPAAPDSVPPDSVPPKATPHALLTPARPEW